MNMRRRDFLRTCTLLTAGTISAPTVAGATRIRVLGESGDQDRLIAIGRISPELRHFLTGVSVGRGKRHGGLTVCWLHATQAAPPLEVATLDEARARGTLIITERAQAS